MFIPVLLLYSLKRKMVYAGVDDKKKGMADYVVCERLCV